MEVIINLHCRCPAACTDAFHFFEREHAICCGSLVLDPEFVFAVFEKLVAAAQQARNVGTDLDVVFTARASGQHGVVADHVADFEFRQLETIGKFFDHFFAQVADFVLGVEQCRHQHRALCRIMRKHFRETGLELIRESHRSISPRTISIEPIAATTSARRRPSHIAGSSCRFARHAALIWTRYGLAVPSLTT